METKKTNQELSKKDLSSILGGSKGYKHPGVCETCGADNWLLTAQGSKIVWECRECGCYVEAVEN